jgi:HPt (histidine-containing phosphotransfer) domain-containing protein
MADLDWDRNFALEQAGDDEEMLAELLVLFHDSSASDLARINGGLAAGDSVAVADAAHSIKGASASLGVEGVRKIAAELEKKGRAGDLSQGGELAAQLAALLKDFEGQR